MGLKPDAIDEIGGTSRPLLEIPVPLSDRVANVVISAVIAPIMVGVLILGGGTEFLPGLVIALILGMTFLISFALARRALILARRPEFAIGKEGFRIRGPKDSEQRIGWEDVSYCRWSHYEPGLLFIQTRDNPAYALVPWPSTREFYKVPEAYRSRVEKAIRAMGKWREGDSDPIPDQAASRANDSTKVKAAAIDEIDGPPVPLVEIPRPRWKIVASLLPALLFFAFIGLFVWVNLHLNGAAAARHGSARLWFLAVFIGIAAIVVPRTTLAWARRPEFAVGKDGIRLLVERRPEWSSLWSLRDLGLFAWEEVSFCRWSRYEPGLLQIQAKATRSLGTFEQPPTRLEYRVPEPYRPSVERAIRAMGKWAD